MKSYYDYRNIAINKRQACDWQSLSKSNFSKFSKFTKL